MTPEEWEEVKQIVASNARAIASNSSAIAGQSARWEETKQIVESNARAIASNSSAIANLRQTVESTILELRAQAAETVQWFADVEERAEQDRTIIREMQADIRGLQTENRRILDELQNRRNGGNGNQ